MISCADILLEETPITSPTSGIDSSLIFNPESDTTCSEYISWNSDVSFFRDSLSPCQSWGSSDLYFKKYRVDVVIN